MQYTALLDRLGVDNLSDPNFIAKIHSSITIYHKSFTNNDTKKDKGPEIRYLDNVSDTEFNSLYASLVDSVFLLDESSQNEIIKHKSLQLLNWSQSRSNWNSIFSAKINDLDPCKINNIILDSKFNILDFLQFPYCIALNLLIHESAVADCLAEPIITSFKYNFENSASKLSKFSKIEHSFLFIKLQFDLCMAAISKAWISLEDNKHLLTSNLQVLNSDKLIDKLLSWQPVEKIGLVLTRYFKKFILSRLSYFVYDYLDVTTDFVLSVSQLANMSKFDDLICNGETNDQGNMKVCRVLIGGLFNLATKWNVIDHQSSLELLKDDTIPSLVGSNEGSTNIIFYWKNLQTGVIENMIPEIFDTILIDVFKELLSTTSKHCELLEDPKSYVEKTIEVFIKKTLDLVKVGWNEIFNIFNSFDSSSKYLKIISDIASLCESSDIKSLIQLEQIYTMRDKMHKIFILCIEEYLQNELKHLPKRIINLDLLEERINILAKHSPIDSFNDILTKVSVSAQNIAMEYTIPSDNLMLIKNESQLELLSENLIQLQMAISEKMPCIKELVYIFKHSDENIDVNLFNALSTSQANQAIRQALHAKLDFQEFALLPRMSN